MLEPARKPSTYEDLYGIPENTTGEIIAGELFVTPRPSRRHTEAASSILIEIGPPYRYGRGGPGGWIILMEPEIGLAENILVPDLAGWKRDRYPSEEPHNWISVSPDWVCEILSPSTARLDKVKKMPVYAQHGVPYLWLVEPVAKTLDIFELQNGMWVLLGSYVEDDKVWAVPFEQVEIDLARLWNLSHAG